MGLKQGLVEDNLAPIVLFAYNRPWHTKKTLEALSKNKLAKQSELYVFLDGVKDNATEDEIINRKKVEEIVLNKKWCGSVVLRKRDRNLGLADNIVDGVTSIVNKNGKIIILEDDILTSKGFLTYMNDALELYKYEEQVMHIAGYMFPLKKEHRLPETFFYNVNSCWGWATWKRAWQHYEHDIEDVYRKLQEHKVNWEKFNNGQNDEYQKQIFNNLNGEIKTWAVKWHSAIYLQGGFSLHPSQSLTFNSGFDGSGTNCGNSNRFQSFNPNQRIKVKKIQLKESSEAIALITDYFKSKKLRKKVSLINRIKARLKFQ